MPIGVTCIDNKFKRKRTKIIKQQSEFAVMEKCPSRDAMARFREEPFQLRYQRMREEHEKNAEFKKSNLLTPAEREKIAVEAAEKANLIITLCVLADCEGYGKVRINRFLENYKTLADSFKEGNENLMEINQTIWERFGIKII